jgi:opine dehydrogenase
MRVAVLGAGNGGQALSAHLALKGFTVHLYEDPVLKANLEGIRKNGGIRLQGALEGFGKLDLITENISEALQQVQFIFLPVPSFAQEPLFKRMLPHLQDGQTLVLIPGNFGSLALLKLIRESGTKTAVTLAETNTLPYACRQIESGLVDVWGVKTTISVAALPAEETESLLPRLSAVFPIPLRPARNVLEIGLSNANMIVHCPTILMNAGWIESTGGNFRFYTEGMSPSVCRVMEAMDRERMEIGEKYGLELVSVAEWLRVTYDLEGESLHQLLSTSPVYGGHGPDAPKKLNHRYITEDVPFLLVPTISLGKAGGIEAPIIGSIISLAGTVIDSDFYRDGRNFTRMGLAGLKVDQIRQVVEKG